MINIKEFFDPTIRIVDVSEVQVFQLRKLLKARTLDAENDLATVGQAKSVQTVEAEISQVENHIIYQHVKEPTLSEHVAQVKEELRSLISPAYSVM